MKKRFLLLVFILMYMGCNKTEIVTELKLSSGDELHEIINYGKGKIEYYTNSVKGIYMSSNIESTNLLYIEISNDHVVLRHTTFAEEPELYYVDNAGYSRDVYKLSDKIGYENIEKHLYTKNGYIIEDVIFNTTTGENSGVVVLVSNAYHPLEDDYFGIISNDKMIRVYPEYDGQRVYPYTMGSGYGFVAIDNNLYFTGKIKILNDVTWALFKMNLSTFETKPLLNSHKNDFKDMVKYPNSDYLIVRVAVFNVGVGVCIIDIRD